MANLYRDVPLDDLHDIVSYEQAVLFFAAATTETALLKLTFCYVLMLFDDIKHSRDSKYCDYSLLPPGNSRNSFFNMTTSYFNLKIKSPKVIFSSIADIGLPYCLRISAAALFLNQPCFFVFIFQGHP